MADTLASNPSASERESSNLSSPTKWAIYDRGRLVGVTIDVEGRRAMLALLQGICQGPLSWKECHGIDCFADDVCDGSV